MRPRQLPNNFAEKTARFFGPFYALINGLVMKDISNNDFCPYDRIVPFKCDSVYRLDEFYRQLNRDFNQNKAKFVYIGHNAKCLCDPELCSRYVEHLIKNLKKYKTIQYAR